MSTFIYYECRDPLHRTAPSRYGIGGIVFRHGTAAYCDGLGVDAQHHWVPTGGVPIESLIRAARDNEVREHGDGDRSRAGYVPNAGGHPHPLTTSP